MKKWSYDKVNRAAEREIKRLMSHDLHDYARGVYLGWYALTCGWQQAGDNGRMEALTETKTNPNYVDTA